MDALHENPGDQHGYCGGKDAVDAACNCPDPVYRSDIRILSGHTVRSNIICGCCELPFLDGWRGQLKLFPSADPPPISGLAKGEGPGG